MGADEMSHTNTTDEHRLKGLVEAGLDMPVVAEALRAYAEASRFAPPPTVTATRVTYSTSTSH